MAATVFGRMQPFVPDKESIEAYLERLAVYFDANGIAAEKVSVLLTVIGAENYTLLRGLQRKELC